MSNMIYTKGFESPEYNIKEILRYSGAKGDMEGAESLIKECIAEAEPVLTYKVCYGEFSAEICGEAVKLDALRINSRGLAKNLEGCRSAILFAATVGIGIDRLIARYGSLSPARALIFQALGAERIEALCDTFCAGVKAKAEEEGKTVRPRFSPGYGDLPLKTQKDFFRILDCSRKIGLTLNESLLMSPSKSVTAIVGIGNCEKKTAYGCASCAKADCEYRKGIREI